MGAGEARRLMARKQLNLRCILHVKIINAQKINCQIKPAALRKTFSGLRFMLISTDKHSRVNSVFLLDGHYIGKRAIRVHANSELRVHALLNWRMNFFRFFLKRQLPALSEMIFASANPGSQNDIRGIYFGFI